MTPERFDRFPDLKGLLGYLKRCAQSVAIDAARQQARRQVEQQAYAHMQAEAFKNPGSRAEQLLEKLAADQLIAWILDCLKNSREKLLFRTSFEWNLKPAATVERWPQEFASVQDVYRVKERILRHLRRNGE